MEGKELVSVRLASKNMRNFFRDLSLVVGEEHSVRIEHALKLTLLPCL